MKSLIDHMNSYIDFYPVLKRSNKCTEIKLEDGAPFPRYISIHSILAEIITANKIKSEK